MCYLVRDIQQSDVILTNNILKTKLLPTYQIKTNAKGHRCSFSGGTHQPVRFELGTTLFAKKLFNLVP